MSNVVAPESVRTRARIDQPDDQVVCRVDVTASSAPVIARSSRDEVFWVRMNNSTRDLSEHDAEVYIREHWGGTSSDARLRSISGVT
jgi:hypothetical protein